MFDVVVDPAGVVFHFGAVIADGAFAIFDGFGESCLGEGERQCQG